MTGLTDHEAPELSGGAQYSDLLPRILASTAASAQRLVGKRLASILSYFNSHPQDVAYGKQVLSTRMTATYK